MVANLTVYAVDSVHLSAEPVPFDKALYASYMSLAVENVPDLISAFESMQYSILPIVLPDPDFIHLQDGGLLPFDPDAFPSRFVRRLLPSSENGVTVYPITVLEVPDSGERHVLNAVGDVIAEIKAPKGYDPLWYVQLRFPDLASLDAETAAWQVALYDPSRIMVRFRLITEDELIKKVMTESVAATQSLTFTPLALSSLSYTGSGLAFDSLAVQTNGTVDVSLSWPSGTLASEGLDIFSCDDLMVQQWQILLTTNVNNAAGSFAFTAPAAGDGEKRFLDAWTHYDGDGDELYDGREVRLYGTDRYNTDTDGDGMPDGWEIQHGLDPLNAADALGDADSDGLTNLGEYQAGTDPNQNDSDGDGLLDGAEANWSRISHWGVNDTGQASIPASLTDAVSISAGHWHCLAARADGTISAWGDDANGEVSGAAGISNAVKVAAGDRYSLALLEDGTVAGWGTNSYGQLNVPASVTNAVSIAAGDYHALALLDDGTVVGWGWNGYDGRVFGASSVSNAIAVAAGSSHSLALLSDGTVQGWGSDSYGQVSGATTVSNAVAIASGDRHSLALRSDGTVAAWGWNYHGQCSGATNVVAAIAIDGGYTHSVAVRADGRVVAWGGNTYGERDVPIGLSHVSTVSVSSYYYTLALSGPLDPLKSGSDGDGLLDGHNLMVDASDPRYLAFAAAGIAFADNGGQRTFKGEADAMTDPFNWQSSGCGIPDGWAVKHGLDPLDPSIKTQDSDNDGLTNYQEMIYGTDPWAADSDWDTVSDYTEIIGGSNPLDAGETSHESGGATFLLSAGYQALTGSGTGNGIATLQIGPLTVPFSHESPVKDLALQLPRAVLHTMSFSGATDHLGGALVLSVDPAPNPMVIHDPAGLFGTPHSIACGYPFAFVAFPVVFLSDVDISISWPDDFYLDATIVPDGLHGVFTYSVPDGYTATPASSTNGATYISADYPQCGYSYNELTVTFVAPSNCLTTIGTLSDTAEISNSTALELDIEPVNDPGYYLGVDQTNTYRAVLNMNTPGTYLWSVDTNYLQIVGSDTGSNVLVTAIASGQSSLYCDFTPEGAPSPCGAAYQIDAVDVVIVLTNVYYPALPILPIYDDTPGKKWVIATFPEPDQINVDWDVQLLGLDSADVNIKYRRGTSAEADIRWVGTTGALHFADGWLNASIRLNDGSNAVPQMSISSNILTISSVQQGDRIIIEHPYSGCRDEIAVVKNFSWNDLQRLGVGNLEMHPDYSGLHVDVKAAIIDTIVFCLDPRPGRNQKLQMSNDSFPDSGLSSITYTNFHAAHTNLLQLDIPSSRSVGSYPWDYDHWHMGIEVATLSTGIVSKQAALETAVSEDADTLGEHQSNTSGYLVTLLNASVAQTNVSFALSHTYEGGEAKNPEYQDTGGGADTLKPGDPIRNIRWQFTSATVPELSYPGDEDNANEWKKATDAPPQEVWSVLLFVNSEGKIVLIGSGSGGAVDILPWAMWSDALGE